MHEVSTHFGPALNLLNADQPEVKHPAVIKHGPFYQTQYLKASDYDQVVPHNLEDELKLIVREFKKSLKTLGLDETNVIGASIYVAEHINIYELLHLWEMEISCDCSPLITVTSAIPDLIEIQFRMYKKQ